MESFEQPWQKEELPRREREQIAKLEELEELENAMTRIWQEAFEAHNALLLEEEELGSEARQKIVTDQSN